MVFGEDYTGAGLQGHFLLVAKAAELVVHPVVRGIAPHDARRQVAAAIPGELPKVDWDSLPEKRDQREKAAAQILAIAHIPYVSQYSARAEGYVYLSARQEPVTLIRGYDWMVRLSDYDKTPIVVEQDTLDPRDAQRLLIGISCGGAWRSDWAAEVKAASSALAWGIPQN